MEKVWGRFVKNLFRISNTACEADELILKFLAQMVKVILKLGVWLKDKTLVVVEDKKVLREAGGWAERPPEDLGVPQLLHIATNQFKFGQVPLRSLCASYMAGSVLVGHFKMLTFIFEVNFHFHGKLWARQLFVYKISLFLVKMQLSE